MKLAIPKGKTGKLIEVFIQDSGSQTGAGLTGLTYNAAGLTAYYYRSGAATATVISLSAMTVGTWVSGGFKEIDAANMPGMYQVGMPDAALSSGAEQVLLHIKGATNMAPLPVEIQLTGPDLNDAAGFGLSRLDAAVATRATPAQVNAEMVDVLKVDTIAEQTQGLPSATPTIESLLGWLWMAWRNKTTRTSTTEKIYNDAGSVLAKSALSDDGTTFTRDERVAGP